MGTTRTASLSGSHTQRPRSHTSEPDPSPAMALYNVLRLTAVRGSSSSVASGGGGGHEIAAITRTRPSAVAGREALGVGDEASALGVGVEASAAPRGPLRARFGLVPAVDPPEERRKEPDMVTGELLEERLSYIKLLAGSPNRAGEMGPKVGVWGGKNHNICWTLWPKVTIRAVKDGWEERGRATYRQNIRGPLLRHSVEGAKRHLLTCVGPDCVQDRGAPNSAARRVDRAK